VLARGGGDAGAQRGTNDAVRGCGAHTYGWGQRRRRGLTSACGGTSRTCDGGACMVQAALLMAQQRASSVGAGAIGKAHAREEWERCESRQHAAKEVGSARAARGSGREPVPLELRRELAPPAWQAREAREGRASAGAR